VVKVKFFVEGQLYMTREVDVPAGKIVSVSVEFPAEGVDREVSARLYDKDGELVEEEEAFLEAEDSSHEAVAAGAAIGLVLMVVLVVLILVIVIPIIIVVVAFVYLRSRPPAFPPPPVQPPAYPPPSYPPPGGR
jgi:hypothetical protein